MTGEKRIALHKALQHLINCNSLENDSNTPDWMLADYLIACLDAWNEGVQAREKWYGREPKAVPVSQWPKEREVGGLGSGGQIAMPCEGPWQKQQAPNKR